MQLEDVFQIKNTFGKAAKRTTTITSTQLILLWEADYEQEILVVSNHSLYCVVPLKKSGLMH